MPHCTSRQWKHAHMQLLYNQDIAKGSISDFLHFATTAHADVRSGILFAHCLDGSRLNSLSFDHLFHVSVSCTSNSIVKHGSFFAFGFVSRRIS